MRGGAARRRAERGREGGVTVSTAQGGRAGSSVRRAGNLMGGGGVSGTEVRPFVENRSALHTAACSTSPRKIDAYTMVCVCANTMTLKM
jgi:hypothetical protein